jgi:hypothetical protein
MSACAIPRVWLETLRVLRSSSRVADHPSLGSAAKLYALAAPAAVSKEIAIINGKDFRIYLLIIRVHVSLRQPRVTPGRK